MRNVDFSEYPKGWFRVGFSKDLKKGEVKTVHYFDQDLVMFRADDHKVYVLDPYCPHLGAHLGKGGRVVGNTLRCPFHGWQLNGKGCVESVPHAKRLPLHAKTKSWPVEEAYGLIFIYYHYDNVAPDHSVPALIPFEDEQWKNQSVFKKIINSTIYEISENGVDRAHFGIVHGKACCDDDNDHMEDITMEEVGSGLKILTNYSVQIGPIKKPAALEVNVLDSAVSYAIGHGGLSYGLVVLPTPINRGQLENVYIFFTRQVPVPFNWLFHRVVQYFVSREIDNDLPIWESKTFWETPALSDFDGPIMPFRRWMAKFYRELDSTIVARSG